MYISDIGRNPKLLVIRNVQSPFTINNCLIRAAEAVNPSNHCLTCRKNIVFLPMKQKDDVPRSVGTRLHVCLAVHYSQNVEPVKYKLLPLKFPLLVKYERLKVWVLLFFLHAVRTFLS